uniref:UDP-glucose flavonoid 3-O-glucosyltransferase 7-like n=1 Tax=Fragaria vesca subsp. vesca TaxID=101020 RepID=UPI0005C9675F|nr:PREDICTED: UDP-glucose flavonoid 3-O-glucosyltransferase 7-like [Fragaria vesca subsp. vesca]
MAAVLAIPIKRIPLLYLFYLLGLTMCIFKCSRKEKTIALSTVNEVDEKEKEPEVLEDSLDEIAYLTKQFDKLLRKRRSFPVGRYPSRGSASRNPKPSDTTGDRTPKPKTFQKSDKCYECGGVGHRSVECPSRKNKSHKAFKVSWSDSNSEQFSDHDDENIALVASIELDEFFEDDDCDISMHNKCSRLVSASKSIKFPTAEVGLPQECESADMITTPEMEGKFFRAIRKLEPQLEQILDQHRPHCLVADLFFPWATDVAAKFGIPRLYFHATGLFSMCAAISVVIHKPHKRVLSETESFVIPGLSDEVKMTRNQIADAFKLDDEAEASKFWITAIECEKRSYGAIFNTFYELEPDYADHYKKVYGMKTWHIGPVSLADKEAEDMATAEQHQCLKWLDSKTPNSVVYVCFGSQTIFADSQLLEIAAGLEASRQDFIWVVKKERKEIEEWLPEGFEKRMQGKGLIIRDWAPQVLILQRKAVGAFLSHCGWNSILEAVSAGIPMITWPVSADNFFIEKLVTQILHVGVGLGVEKWVSFVDESLKREASVKREAIEKAVTRITEGNEAKDIRDRVKALKEMASRAVDEGGSSLSDLNALIEELRTLNRS